MAIVKVYNKARDITYVYESESYWDKDLKQPRSHRRLIGRIDPNTGNVVPTGKKTKKQDSRIVASDTVDYKVLYEKALITIEQKNSQILELKSHLATAESVAKSLRSVINKATAILESPVSGKEQNYG